MRRAAGLCAFALAACTSSRTPVAGGAAPTGTARVGPPRGSVMVVGGGALGPEVYARFIELAGGPDAVIIDVPTAGGDSVYPPNWRGADGLKGAGARQVIILHTIDRKVADSEGFVAPLKTAGGVWFEGGRQYHLVDSYGGTKTEQAFDAILARGGVMAGSSAGASILGSYLVRGAPSNNNFIMSYPGYERGFGFLRGVGIDQHVVARERLADLADSVMPRHPELLGISEDEGTAWVVRGDAAEIIGRDKAFVYGGKDANDPGKPFLTLHPGDKYNLAARRVTHRAIEESSLTQAFVDSVFAPFARPGAQPATVLVAENGKVFIDASYGIPPQRKYMPATTIPNFPLYGLSDGFNAVVNKGGPSYTQEVTRRIYTPIGMHKTVADSVTGEFQSNVDELYRWELGLTAVKGLNKDGLGWQVDSYKGLARQSEYGTSDGKRNAFVRFPAKHAAIIILTSDANADARGMANRIADRLLFPAR